MAKNCVILIVLVFNIFELSAQKKEIDIDAIKSWVRLADYAISDDGKYVWFTEYSEKEGSSLTLSNTIGKRLAHFHKVQSAKFTFNSKFFICSAEEGLHIFDLQNEMDEFISGGTNIDLPDNGTSEWCSFKINTTYFLKNLKTGKQTSYFGIESFQFNNAGTMLVLQISDSLRLVELKNGRSSTIYFGKPADRIVFNEDNSKIAFISNPVGPANIYVYNIANAFLDSITQNEFKEQLSGSSIRELIRFTSDGNGIVFKRQPPKEAIRRSVNILTDAVDIWSYTDRYFQSQQLQERPFRPLYTTLAHLQSKNITCIEDSSFTLSGQMGKKYALLKTRTNEYEAYWRKEEVPIYALLSLQTGEKISLPFLGKSDIRVVLSPSEKYITWIDTAKGEYKCYDIVKSKAYTLNGIKASPEFINFNKFNTPFNISSWLKNDEAFIAYDDYDIWKIDPENMKQAVCVSAGYGKSNRVLIRPVTNNLNLVFNRHGHFLAVAMDLANRNNGFCWLKTSESVTPLITNTGPYFYYFPAVTTEYPVRPPVKAKLVDVFIFQRQSDTLPSNVFVTRDFNRLITISHLATPKTYRWHYSKVVHWQSDGGKSHAGILYIPSELDTTQKHPVIFNYYEEHAKESFLNRKPSLTSTNINIPWYTSRGYIVFLPDIEQEVARNGENALEAVESGADYLVRHYPWIDASKIGLQGHSHGGYLTNYIVTHSKRFAAAQSSAGYSNFISGYGQVGFGEMSLQNMQEVGGNNLGTTPWDGIDTYIKSSCIFTVDSVETPLLLMHNKGDGVVNFYQSLELFGALRRLQKKVWLLQYDKEDHVLGGYKNVLDFTYRQQQFFDHFLKGLPAPSWMVEGVPARYKGIRSGLEVGEPE